ncbi:MAG: tetratricopeptide repeat protein [Phenylobacterium sp.]
MSKSPISPRERPRTIAEALEAAAAALRTGRGDEAERLAAYVLKSSRGSVPAARMLGQALLIQDRPEEAVAPLERAARGTDDPETETLLARALSRAGRIADAIARLERATARRPPFPLAFLELGHVLREAGRTNEAIEVLDTGLRLTPDAAVLRIGLAYAHLDRNDRAKARALFSEVHSAAPQRYDARIGLARVMVADGEYRAAAELFRQALEMRPEDGPTRIALARCLLETGDRAGGEAVLRAATRGGSQLALDAITTLAATPHGRVFLRPSAAASFLRRP